MNSISALGVTISNPDTAGWLALLGVVGALFVLSLFSPEAEQAAIYIALAITLVLFLRKYQG